jgi:hypothetical protein
VKKPSPYAFVKRPKYKNKKVEVDGEKYDSKKEAAYNAQLELLKNAANPAQMVVKIERQVKYELLPKQDGERAVSYLADFRVTFADGHIEVIDVKSSFTQKLPAYVLKRKMMLFFHGIKIKEVC